MGCSVYDDGNYCGCAYFLGVAVRSFARKRIRFDFYRLPFLTSRGLPDTEYSRLLCVCYLAQDNGEESFFALIPVAIYSLVYFVMVVLIPKELGGWDDFYGFATRMPLWISVTSVLPLTFGITTLIRLWHNRSFVNRRKNEAQIFLDYFDGKEAKEILSEMGKARAKIQPSGDVIVPTVVIKKIMYFTDSTLSINDACKIYLDWYLASVREYSSVP